MSYAIAAGNADGAFAIDESTGELTIADNSALDYEVTSQRSLQVTVTDSGSPARSATGTIVVGVSDVNEAPQVDSQLIDQAIGANVLFDFELPENAFVDADAGDSLRYAAQLADGSELPNWLSFNSSLRRFSGAASEASVGTLEIRVTASDRGTPALTATQSFQLAINSNPFPWHHAANPRDVNRDGTIAPVDVLIVINEVNSPKISRVGGRLPLPHDPLAYPFDVNADGFVTPIDALVVINYLNQAVVEGEFSFVPDWGTGIGAAVRNPAPEQRCRGRDSSACNRDATIWCHPDHSAYFVNAPNQTFQGRWRNRRALVGGTGVRCSRLIQRWPARRAFYRRR